MESEIVIEMMLSNKTRKLAENCVAALFLFFFYSPHCAGAELSVPHFFSDHMVLQQGKAVKVWGRATPGEEVSAQFRGATGTARARDDGKWELRIQSGKADSEGHRLVIWSGEEEVAIEDVLVGEVWFAAGQSNMMWKLSTSANPSEAIAAAENPLIRMFHSPEVTAERPQDDIEGKWTVCTSETAGDYSAVAYYYARKLQRELDIPVGVIVSAWGAKRIESFISRDALNSQPETKPLVEALFRLEKNYDPVEAQALYEQRKVVFDEWLAKGRAVGEPRPRPARVEPTRPLLDAGKPGVIFNSMIHPFIGYNIRGVIWYQGESNAHDKLVPYDILLPLLIQDWRSRWGHDFPFYFVQLASFRAPNTEPGISDPWPLLQDRMRRVLDSTPKTGMAVITDAGDENNIHPKDKQTPGERLARWALAMMYGKEIVYSGPLYESYVVQAASMTVRFSSVAEGLESRDGKALQRFEIAGSDGKWHWANAEIVGTNQVKLSHLDISKPVAARYAWASNPAGANLVNSEGLPASVFCTQQ